MHNIKFSPNNSRQTAVESYESRRSLSSSAQNLLPFPSSYFLSQRLQVGDFSFSSVFTWQRFLSSTTRESFISPRHLPHRSIFHAIKSYYWFSVQIDGFPSPSSHTPSLTSSPLRRRGSAQRTATTLASLFFYIHVATGLIFEVVHRAIIILVRVLQVPFPLPIAVILARYCTPMLICFVGILSFLLTSSCVRVRTFSIFRSGLSDFWSVTFPCHWPLFY